MSLSYGFLLLVASAVEVQLAWQHDGFRLAGMTVALLVPLAVAGLLPAASWHRPGPLPNVPTHVPGAAHVAACQRYAAGWNPSHSARTLRRWQRCMGIRP